VVWEAAIRNNLAYILAVLERGGSEALELSNQAIDVLGPTPDLLDTRSLANLVAGQFPAAVADARQSITDSPSAMKYFHLARALLASGDRQAAARAIQVARDNHQLGRDKVPPAERDQFDKLESAVKGV